MTNPILLPIDLSQQSSWQTVLPVAEKMARDNNADLHVLTVIPDFGMAVVGSFFPADYAKNTMKETEQLLEKFASDHLPADLNIQTHVRFGTIYKEVLKVANEIQCSLIIMESHRPETKDYLLGPNAARVVRHARQSVYVVRG